MIFVKRHLTDDELDDLLKDYGSLPPPAPFTYTKKPAAGGRRIAVLALVALLSSLLLALTVGIAARFTDTDTSAPTTVYPTDERVPSVTTQKLPITTPPKTPESTDPPIVTSPPITTPPSPPETKPPVLSSLLPDWYAGTSISMVNFLLSSGTPSLLPTKLEEVYDDYASFDLDAGGFNYHFVSGDLVKILASPANHRESFCAHIYLKPSTGELFCLGHELKDLWQTVGIDRESLTFFNVYYAAENGERYVIVPHTDSNRLGYYIYDRTAKTLQKVDFDFANHDSDSYSPNCNLIVVATIRKNDDMLNDLQLINTNTMEIKPICAGYDTFGISYFSPDERFIYTYLRVDGTMEQNEYAHWVMYDTETGLTFRGEGEILYLQKGILISRTPNGMRIYDCQTGVAPAVTEGLPHVVDGEYKSSRHTLSLLDPLTGETTVTLSDVGTYELTGDQRYLYYYVHSAPGVVLMDLFSGETVTLPVSDAFWKGANPEVGRTIYSLAISSDGSKISLGYKISMDYIYEQRREDIKALEELLDEAVLKTNSIPAFWAYFNEHRTPFDYLITETSYDIHDGYVILQIEYYHDSMFDMHKFNTTLTVQLLEDYRDNTFTRYRVYGNPYRAGWLYARSAYETKVQTFRRKLKDADYDTSCALLQSIGTHRPYYIDYADCYDQKGKWSDKLEAAAVCNAEFLKEHTVYVNYRPLPERFDEILEIVSRYPIYSESTPEKKLFKKADLYFRDANSEAVYGVEIIAGESGAYYLKRTDLYECYRKITEAEYLILMEALGKL